jgi:nucleoside 2-deoxyribosyltransferase
MNKTNTANKKIYWANALFTEADRRFNAYCVDKLRKAGFNVFLPQEASVNKEKALTAKDIFKIDTTEIICSDLLIACLDQETIDSEVACEIGIAYAFGIPVIGLYTDIRQYRSGIGQMYKNLYVIGAIEYFGEIARNIEELQQIIPKFLDKRGQTNTDNKLLNELTAKHYEEIADTYESFIEELVQLLLECNSGNR